MEKEKNMHLSGLKKKYNVVQERNGEIKKLCKICLVCSDDITRTMFCALT